MRGFTTESCKCSPATAGDEWLRVMHTTLRLLIACRSASTVGFPLQYPATGWLPSPTNEEVLKILKYIGTPVLCLKGNSAYRRAFLPVDQWPLRILWRQIAHFPTCPLKANAGEFAFEVLDEETQQKKCEYYIAYERGEQLESRA